MEGVMQSKLSIKKRDRISEVKIMLMYLLIFYLMWALKELWLVKYIELFDENTSAIFEAIVKFLIWIVPAWLYIKYYLNISPVHYLKLNVNVKKGLLWGAVLSLVLGLYFAFGTYILNGKSFQFSLSFDDYLNSFLMAGIAEEIVFRGLILQEINKKITFWKANIITALLFLVIHYPIWIYNSEFFVFGTHIYIFAVGLFFGFVYKKSGSLWSVVILHIFHNFIVMIS